MIPQHDAMFDRRWSFYELWLSGDLEDHRQGCVVFPAIRVARSAHHTLEPDGKLRSLQWEPTQRWPEVPAVLVSGLWSPRMMRAGFLAGAIDRLEKSADSLEALTDIMDRVERARPPLLDVGPFTIPTAEEIMDEFYLGLVDIYGGNVTRAAEAGGVHRTSLQRSTKRAKERTGERKSGGDEGT